MTIDTKERYIAVSEDIKADIIVLVMELKKI